MLNFHIWGHLETYRELGHPYVQDCSVGKGLTWILCMSPLMAGIMANSDFIELDATFKASIDLDNMINVVTFDYKTAMYILDYIQDFNGKVMTDFFDLLQGWLLLESG